MIRHHCRLRILFSYQQNKLSFISSASFSYYSQKSTSLPAAADLRCRGCPLLLTKVSTSRHDVSSRSQITTSTAPEPNSSSVHVYHGALTSQIKAVKFFSLVTSCMGLAAQPLLVQKAAELNSLGLGIAVGSFVGFFTFITPFLLHWITKKYVTSLDFNPQTNNYTASTISLLLREKKKTFELADVTVPDVAGMFTTFNLRDGTSLFVDPRLFTNPDHYARIMGYDKPIDFKLDSDNKKPDS